MAAWDLTSRTLSSRYSDYMIEADASNVAVFKALGDSTRQLIMQVLSHQELAVNELVDCLGLPQSTVSRHLRVLRQAGLIVDRREGVTVYCRMAAPQDADESAAGSVCRWFEGHPLPSEIQAGIRQVLARRRQRSSEFFEKIGGRWDELRRGCFGQEFLSEAVLGLLPREWTVADLGTGTGHLLPALARAFRRVIAVDHSESMLSQARQRISSLGLGNVDLRPGELEELPIESGQIDLAIAMLVLHHVGQPPRALAEVARVLRPGGHLLIVEIDQHHDDELRQAMGDLWMGFAPSRLSEMAGQAGLSTRRTMPLSGRSCRAESHGEGPLLFAMICQAEDRAVEDVVTGGSSQR